MKEGRDIFNKILDNTSFSNASEEELTEEVQTVTQASSPEQLDPQFLPKSSGMPEPSCCSISEPEPQHFNDSQDSHLDFPYDFYDELFHGFCNVAWQTIM